MKKSNIIKGLSAVAVVLGFSACSSNYLDVQPTTNTSSSEITATVQNAQMALYGICNAMQTQYQSTAINQYNGESYVNTLCNDAMGPDYISGLGIASYGEDVYKMTTLGNGNLYMTEIPWSYCYNLITQANQILVGIDNAEGDDAQRDFVKAQALTFRAFGYVKLLQWYAPRWEDSNNGSDYCIVLRTEPGVGECPLSTMSETLDLVYSDLDKAIELFKGSSFNRTYKWEPDLSIAQGVYARAALIKNDWSKAQAMAHDARQGYTIMDNDTFLSGFAYDNSDFMWEQAIDEASIYYWSWGSHYSANGGYVQNWGLGAGAINVDLARQLDPNDIRLQCFITPDKIALMNSKNLNRGKVTDAYFYDAELVDLNNNLNLGTGFTTLLDVTKNSKRWGLYNFALNYIVYYYENIYKGDQSILENEGFYPYYTLATGSDGAQILNHTDASGKNLRGKLVCTPFGAQLKFVSIPPYGTSAYPFMRASEMCLAEAEAAYHAGDIPTAQKCLMEINGKRIPGYSYAGKDLLEEIRLSRRIELWGEGQGWSDWKRWNLPIERHIWKENEVTSGNWPTAMGSTKDGQPFIISNVPSQDNSWWRFALPLGEYDYNKAIDRSLLPW